MSVFAMPSLGADMEAGTLVEWLVKPGDRVKHGDVVAVVETQKGAIEIEIFEDGVVERLDAKVGDRLPVGAPLALIGGGKEKPEEPVPPAPAPEPRPQAAVVEAPRPPQPAAPGSGAPPASPAARALAAERGLALAGVVGSGPGGAILLADVEALAETERPAPKPGLDLAAMRAAIAAAMARSKREIPHYYLTQTLDLQSATDWLGATNADRSPEQRLLMGALFVRAAARAARAVPEVNGWYEQDAYRPSQRVHAASPSRCAAAGWSRRRSTTRTGSGSTN